MVLDLGTLYAVAALASLVAGLLHLIPWLTRRFGQWAVWWGAGHVAVGLSSLLVAIYDVQSITMPVLIPNVISVAGYALVLQGVRVFERPDVRWMPLGIVVCIVAIPLLLSHDPDQFVGRVAYLCTVRACCDAAVACIAIRLARRKKLQNAWLMAIMFGATVPLFLGRAYLAMTGQIGRALLGPTDSLAAWLVAGAIAFIVFRGFSLLLLDTEKSQQSLAELACRDPLTGALNRLGLAQLRSGLEGRVALMMIDIDRFKMLNDVEGHAVGDAALRLLADEAQELLGSSGSLIRTGGDEFLCIMPRLSPDQAQRMADAIETGFDRVIIGITQIAPRPTLSIGLAEGAVVDGLEPLLVEADEAMYAIKRARQGPHDRRRAA